MKIDKMRVRRIFYGHIIRDHKFTTKRNDAVKFDEIRMHVPLC